MWIVAQMVEEAVPKNISISECTLTYMILVSQTVTGSSPVNPFFRTAHRVMV